MVYVEDVDGCSPDGRLSDQYWPVPPEMGTPPLTSRIEESRQPATLRVDPGDVRAFVEIVVRAREGEVFVCRLTPMLFGDDVIDWESEFGDISWDLAVFATISGSFPDAPVQRCVHGLRFLPGLLKRKNGLGLQDR
jgi:hypothetical protein